MAYICFLFTVSVHSMSKYGVVLQVTSALWHIMDQIIKGTAYNLYEYIHTSSFKEAVFSGTETQTGLRTAYQLKERVENEIHRWLENHAEKSFPSADINNLGEQVDAIRAQMHKIQREMQGIRTEYSVLSRFAEALGSYSTGLYGSIVFSRFFGITAGISVALLGITRGVLMSINISENIFNEIIDSFSIEYIKRSLCVILDEKSKIIIQDAFGYKHTNLNESINTMEKNLDEYREKEDQLRSLSSTISRCFDEINSVAYLTIGTQF